MRQEKHFAAAQIQGRRPYQEDDYGFYQPEPDRHSAEQLLAVVADGMGGEIGGGQASGAAIGAFLEVFIAHTGTVRERLLAALRHANRELGLTIEEKPNLDGMGTTLLAVALTPEGLHWVSVGDSPLFLIRNNTLSRLNADHSYGAELKRQVAGGTLAPQEAAASTNGSSLLSAVMGKPIELIDCPPDPLPLQPGDCILLATDGIDTLDNPEIVHLVQSMPGASAQELANACTEAVTRANRPHQDNTTVLAIMPECQQALDPSLRPLPSTQPAPARGLAKERALPTRNNEWGKAALALALVLIATLLLWQNWPTLQAEFAPPATKPVAQAPPDTRPAPPPSRSVADAQAPATPGTEAEKKTTIPPAASQAK